MRYIVLRQGSDFKLLCMDPKDVDLWVRDGCAIAILSQVKGFSRMGFKTLLVLRIILTVVLVKHSFGAH